VQFGFISSSPSLQHCSVYPNYFSLVPNEHGLNPARVKLMECFKWSRAIILYGTEDVWTKTAQDLSNSFREEYQVVSYSVSADSNLKEVLQRAMDTKIRIIFVLTFNRMTAKILCQGYRSGIRSTTHTWILMYVGNNPDWYLNKSNCAESEMREVANGHFTLDIAQHDPQNVKVTLPTNKTVEEVTEEIRELYSTRNFSDLELVYKDYFGYGYDTTVAVAKMLKMYTETNSTLTKLHNFQYTDKEVYQQLYNILTSSTFNFSGITGDISFHNRKCKPSSSHWGLIMIRYNQNDHSSKIFEINVANARGTGCPKLIHEPNWPGGSRPSDFPESHHSSRVAFGVILGLSSIGIIFAMAFLIYGIVHRNVRIFRLSGIWLNSAVAIGGIAGYLGIIFDGLNGQFFDLQLWSCFTKICLYALCFTGTFGIILVQMWAVSLGVKKSNPYKPKRRLSATRIKLTEQNLLIMVGLMLAVDVIIIIIWFSVDPWEIGTRPLESGQFSILEQDRCTCDNFWIWVYVFSVYKGILMAFGVYLAYDTRQIRVPFVTDSRFMAVAVYTALACCLMLFTLLHVDMTNPAVYYVLMSILCLLFCTVPLLLIYLPKIYAIKFRPDKTVGGVGPARGLEKDSMSEHTIASSEQLNMLKKRNVYQREVIQMLIEEVHTQLVWY
jgi:gamma-aminobutyric acid type B receptor